MDLKLNHMTLQIDLPPGVAADPKLLDGGHPLYYVIARPNQTVEYLNKVHELLEGLPPLNVLEFCAGIGLVHASNPQLYRVGSLATNAYWGGIELDPSCEPLAKVIAPDMDFHLGDMYDPEFTNHWEYPSEESLVICEFSNNTLPKLWREQPRAQLMERITQDIKPAYLYIADVGYYWIHLANHWPLYERVFGTRPTRGNYHELFDRYASEHWGYTVKKWTVGGGAQYFLLQPLE